MSRRTERIAEAIRHEISRMILTELADPRIGFVTVTRVEVAPDLSLAKIYLSVMDSEARERDTIRGLNSAKKRMTRALADAVDLRKIPELAFFVDPGVKRSIRIGGILDDLARERDEQPDVEQPDSNSEQDEQEEDDDGA